MLKGNFMATHVTALPKSHTTSPLWEILLVIAVSLGISLLVPSMKTLGTLLLPVAYLLVEHYLRKRNWTEGGFNFRSIPRELLRNLGWVLLVGIGTQAVASFGSYFFLPEYLAHVIARLPVDVTSITVPLLIALLLGTFAEEVIFRGLFQKRLSAFLPVWAAIGLSSLVFAALHFSPGPALVVFIDLAMVLVDSLIYGVIFARSNNIFVSWAAHFLADIAGVVFMLALIK
jgi:uncharacterized protein